MKPRKAPVLCSSYSLYTVENLLHYLRKNLTDDVSLLILQDFLEGMRH